MSFKRLLSILTLSVVICLPGHAASDTTEVKSKATAYEKLVKGFKQSAKGKFLSLHKDGKGKVYVEYAKTGLGRRFLAGSTVRTVTDPAIYVGYKYSSPVCFQIELQDSLVVLLQPQLSASSDNPQMAKAMERSYGPKIYKRLAVAAFNKDSSTFFFDATSLINGLAPKTSEFKTVKGDDQSTWFGDIKAFDDNASIVVHNNVERSRSFLGITVELGDGSMSSTVSFLLLPEEKMKPRIQDSRVGVFSTGSGTGGVRYEISDEEDGFRSYRLANRWKVEPVDTAAWKRGELTDVKKQIVWYVDDAFPSKWKAPIRQAVLDWNIAFEKAGLRNVMAVKDFPTPDEDPEFDPDNLKYSCIRYIPNATMNAMGPSWVDPVTGEILNASVLVYNDVIRLINNWRFVQTAQVDERVRAKKLPDEVMDESLEYVVRHEVGHTLGLMHNMGASAAVPVDSLRSATFTAKYGTTPSIMDYARFNYVAQPGDKGVALTPPKLGVYDEYVIKWLYSPVPDAKDMWEEAAAAGKMIDEKAGNPLYIYRAQQNLSSSYPEYDPSARSEDLGDDPVKGGDYGIANLKYILKNLNAWIEDDPDRTHRSELYDQMANQYYRYLNNVLAQIGGIYLLQVKDGTPGEPAVPVPARVQKKSLKWVVSQIADLEWLDDKEVTSRFTLDVPTSALIASQVATNLSATIPDRVLLCASVAGGKEGYSLPDYYSDLYDELFDGTPDIAMRALQRNVVTAVAKPVTAQRNKTSLTDDAFEYDFGEDQQPYRRKISTAAIDETPGCREVFLKKVRKMAGHRRHFGSAENKAHYEYLYRTASAAFGK